MSVADEGAPQDADSDAGSSSDSSGSGSGAAKATVAAAAAATAAPPGAALGSSARGSRRRGEGGPPSAPSSRRSRRSGRSEVCGAAVPFVTLAGASRATQAGISPVAAAAPRSGIPRPPQQRDYLREDVAARRQQQRLRAIERQLREMAGDDGAGGVTARSAVSPAISRLSRGGRSVSRVEVTDGPTAEQLQELMAQEVAAAAVAPVLPREEITRVRCRCR